MPAWLEKATVVDLRRLLWSKKLFGIANSKSVPPLREVAAKSPALPHTADGDPPVTAAEFDRRAGLAVPALLSRVATDPRGARRHVNQRVGFDFSCFLAWGKRQVRCRACSPQPPAPLCEESLWPPVCRSSLLRRGGGLFFGAQPRTYIS